MAKGTDVPAKGIHKSRSNFPCTPYRFSDHLLVSANYSRRCETL